MFINYDKKFIFVAIARTGSTSMYSNLTGLGDNVISYFDRLPNEYHMPIKDILEKNENIETYFKFCFVRNPYTRFLSSWKEFYFNNKNHSSWSKEITNYNNFKDFCLNFKNTNFYKDKEIHFRTQTEIISINGKICMDKICKFENMYNEIKEIEKMLNVNFNYIHHKRSTSNNKKYKNEINYDEEMRNIIYEIYKEDFINFGYER